MFMQTPMAFMKHLPEDCSARVPFRGRAAAALRRGELQRRPDHIHLASGMLWLPVTETTCPQTFLTHPMHTVPLIVIHGNKMSYKHINAILHMHHVHSTVTIGIAIY